MPIYDFRCEVCGNIREAMVPSDVVGQMFPCAHDTVMCFHLRVLSAPAVQVAMKDRAVCPPLRRYDGTE